MELICDFLSLQHQTKIKMEDIYFMISDCVHNLSNLFAFDPLLQISAISKRHLNLIYQLRTDNIIYYTSIDQLKRFRNINTLTIPRYYQYNFRNINNLSNLNHINNIILYNFDRYHYIALLTHLTSVKIATAER